MSKNAKPEQPAKLRIKKKNAIKPLRQPNRFRVCRIARGWTQQEAATLLGCTPSKITMTEMGERGLSEELAVIAADLYKVSVDYLLCQTDIPTKPVPSKTQGENMDMDKEIAAVRAHWEEVGIPEFDTNRRKMTRYTKEEMQKKNNRKKKQEGT